MDELTVGQLQGTKVSQVLISDGDMELVFNITLGWNSNLIEYQINYKGVTRITANNLSAAVSQYNYVKHKYVK